MSFFYFDWFDYRRDQPGEHQISSPCTLHIFTWWLFPFSSSYPTPALLFPFSSEYQPSSPHLRQQCSCSPPRLTQHCLAHDGLSAARHLLPQPPMVPPRTSVRKQLSGVKREVDVCHCFGSKLSVTRSNLPSLTRSHLFSQTLPSPAGSPAHPCGCCFQAWSWHMG